MQAAIDTIPTSKWKFLKEALSGTEQDFTEGSLSRGIALLAIPTVLEMFMESTFGLVDAFWVARLGSDAIAGEGPNRILDRAHFQCGHGLSMAATATVARRIGEKDAEGAVASVQTIGCGIAISVAAGIAGASPSGYSA